MTCYGYYDEQPCKFHAVPDTDFCPCHTAMYNMSLVLQKPHQFFDEPKVYKTEYRYKLRYITSYKYFALVYKMEKFIEAKLNRLKHFFEATLIQRCFKRAMSNPEYKMCRERLLREYKVLNCV